MTDTNTLVDKVFFVKIVCRSFGNLRKAIVDMSSQPVDETRFSHKQKLLKSDELKAIASAYAGIKSAVYMKCLPYDKGIRAVPKANVEIVTNMLTEFETKTLPPLVDALLDVYEQQVEESKLALGPHFNPSLFPSREVMKSRFSFEWGFINYGAPGSLKDISPALFASEQAKHGAKLQDATSVMLASMADGIKTVTDHLLDRLAPGVDGSTKRLHKSAVDAIQEAVANFKTLNVLGNKDLESAVSLLETMTQGVDVEKLRENDGLRIDLSAKLAQVSAALTPLVEVKGRKFRDVEVVE